jgi:hypothetical protein
VLTANFTSYGRLFDNNNNGIAAAEPDTTQAYAGDISNDTFSRYVMVFQLPTLGVGETLGAATFTVTLRSVVLNNSDVNLDVAFLEKGSSSVVKNGDYSASPTAYLGGIATPNTPADTTLTWSNTALADAITDAYEKGNSYVAFRLQLPESGDFWSGAIPISDVDGAHDYYGVYTVGTDHEGPNPTLQFTVIP